MTPLIYRLFSGAAWWSAYHATPCPPGAPYFTVLLWHRARVQGAPAQAAQLPFENSIMGEGRRRAEDAMHCRWAAGCRSHVGLASCGGPLQPDATAPPASLARHALLIGRDLKSISGTVGGLPVRVATAHLESPTSGNALYRWAVVRQGRAWMLGFPVLSRQ